jgi:PKD repeat protein
VIRGLAAEPHRTKEAARAYLYLGVAYVGLRQPTIAKAKFRQALQRDSDLRLSPDEFPPNAVRAFESARGALETATALETEARRRSKKPWVLLGLGGAGAAGVAAFLGRERQNRAPTATLSIEPQGQALINATRLTFTASASDPEGEPLTFFWAFGDGESANGQVAAHVYAREGPFTVTLTVRDGLTSTTVTGSVTARSLTGRWRVAGALRAVAEYVIEHGAGLRVDPVFADLGLAQGPVSEGRSASVSDPRRVTIGHLVCRGPCPSNLSAPSVVQVRVSGEADSAIQTITGLAACVGPWQGICSAGQGSVTLMRE